MANKVTQEDIKKFNELYYKLKTYAAVARETGFSAGTVKRYINPNYKPVDTSNIKHFTLNDLPDPELDWLTPIENFGTLCVLTNEEKAEMEELWKEMEL